MAKKNPTKGSKQGGVWTSGQAREVTKAMRAIDRARKVVAGSAMPTAAHRSHGDSVALKPASQLRSPSGYVLTTSEGRRVKVRPASLPRYRMEIAWSAEDEAYIVTVPDLPGCMTHGATYSDAARRGEDAIEAWLDGARHWGRPIPLPGSAGVAR